MFKKFGIVTVGITAGLLAAAPLASAGEAPEHGGHGHEHGEHHGDHKGEHKGGGSDCNVTGGSAEANGGINGNAGLLGNALAQAPVGGANLGNIVCNDILNDNLSGNNVAVSVLSDDTDVPVVLDEEETETADVS